jgi:hypothetical protein
MSYSQPINPKEKSKNTISTLEQLENLMGGATVREIDLEDLKENFTFWKKLESQKLKSTIVRASLCMIRDGRSTGLVFDKATCDGYIQTVAKLVPELEIYDFIIGTFIDHLGNREDQSGKDGVLEAYNRFYSNLVKGQTGDVPMGERFQELLGLAPVETKPRSEVETIMRQARVEIEEEVIKVDQEKTIEETIPTENHQKTKEQLAKDLKYPLRVLSETGIVDMSKIELTSENLERLLMAFYIFEKDVSDKSALSELTLVGYRSNLQKSTEYKGKRCNYESVLTFVKLHKIDLSDILTPIYLERLNDLQNPKVSITFEPKIESPQQVDESTVERVVPISHIVNLETHQRMEVNLVIEKLKLDGIIEDFNFARTLEQFADLNDIYSCFEEDLTDALPGAANGDKYNLARAVLTLQGTVGNLKINNGVLKSLALERLMSDETKLAYFKQNLTPKACVLLDEKIVEIKRQQNIIDVEVIVVSEVVKNIKTKTPSQLESTNTIISQEDFDKEVSYFITEFVKDNAKANISKNMDFWMGESTQAVWLREIITNKIDDPTIEELKALCSQFEQTPEEIQPQFLQLLDELLELENERNAKLEEQKIEQKSNEISQETQRLIAEKKKSDKEFQIKFDAQLARLEELQNRKSK